METAINGSVPELVRDGLGNVKGGIRLPQVTVPIASYQGLARNSLGGQTIPFSTEQLRELYPEHEDYVSKVKAAALESLADGVILPHHATQYIQEAESALIPPP
ncbi:hypothetical protein B7463_g1670, partial [Scytalidium lignicola]